MKVTKREFRIAAAASLFGFFCCYFLAGEPTPPRGASQMTFIYSLPKTSAPPEVRNFSIPLNRTNAAAPRFLPIYTVKPRAELRGPPARPNVDLFSDRYKAEVDLRDLY